MATQSNLNVSLTPRFMQMLREYVKNGRYQSASEVVRESLRLLEERDKEQELYWAVVRKKVSQARKDIEHGRVIDGRTSKRNMLAYMDQKEKSAKVRRKAG